MSGDKQFNCPELLLPNCWKFIASVDENMSQYKLCSQLCCTLLLKGNLSKSDSSQRYLRGSVHQGLLFKRNESKNILMHTVVEISPIQSLLQVICYRMLAKLCITWQSKKQFCIALSTAEAGYMVLQGAAQ